MSENGWNMVGIGRNMVGIGRNFESHKKTIFFCFLPYSDRSDMSESMVGNVGCTYGGGDLKELDCKQLKMTS